MSYAEKMAGPSQPEIGQPDNPNQVARESLVQKKSSEIEALIKELGPAAASHQIAEKQIDLEEKNNNLVEQAQLAGKDPLTGLDNRRTFEEEIHRAVVAALRNGKPISVIFADIDHFKEINDKEGHSAGDSVLRGVSNEIKNKGIRETDRACRYGGEEIVVILPDTPSNQAIGVAERLRRKIATSPTTFEGKQITVEASFGVSSFTPTNSGLQKTPEEIETTINQLIHTADNAMYAAKEAGRNKTGFVNPDGKVAVLVQDPNQEPNNIHSKLIAKYKEP